MSIRTTLLPLATAALLAGCGSTTPHYDARFGDAVRSARMQMTINPDAGKTPGTGADAASGMDGRATRHTLERYQQSYKSPPQAVNVINIGGSLSGAGGGGGGGGGSGGTP
ncbi:MULTISPECIES: hypothetical protein [Comamonas]|jgi:uncharacterized protein YceK|uniref:Pilus assembly protein n=1 Tax=Comamonas terrigena TaxID=32013 RepID=A0A2A7USJ5_COMTR|nr:MULTISPECIES: hypothetical protein [Comamonas]MBP7353083.1 hypothetical protein [Comamonas sp.]PEH88166.1 hypothetical protein CRM82_05700 [Comamonas terrigena]BBL23099.1 hypothetical protein CT3_05540 [Comamonas terrigena NBRC 13299]SUY87266.1 Uncharacterised protein [Comamonas terrigena]